MNEIRILQREIIPMIIIYILI